MGRRNERFAKQQRWTIFVNDSVEFYVTGNRGFKKSKRKFGEKSHWAENRRKTANQLFKSEKPLRWFRKEQKTRLKSFFFYFPLPLEEGDVCQSGLLERKQGQKRFKITAEM